MVGIWRYGLVLAEMRQEQTEMLARGVRPDVLHGPDLGFIAKAGPALAGEVRSQTQEEVDADERSVQNVWEQAPAMVFC